MKRAKGIDVSHHQDSINWEKVKSQGYSFAFVKCTEGKTYLDPRFASNWEHLKKVGLRRGAYHFYSLSSAPIEQATHYLQKLGTLSEHDLPPVLDVENVKGKKIIDKDSYQQDVLEWLAYVKEQTNRTPIIYTNSSFGKHYLTNAAFANYPLWIADYGETGAPQKSAPTIPPTWKNKGWLFWQQSDHASVLGIKKNVDSNVFNGTLEDLEHYFRLLS